MDERYRLDSGARRSYDPAMPLWRCPHCGTPQAEAARCWVCRRSTTSCATCRHFRRGVTAQLGYCGLDRRRLALHGDEMRACWSAPDPAAPIELEGRDATGARPAAAVTGTAAATGTGRPVRTFVPVEEVSPPRAEIDGRGARRQSRPARVVAAEPAGAGSARWSLWGDAEPPA